MANIDTDTDTLVYKHYSQETAGNFNTILTASFLKKHLVASSPK